MIYGMIYEKLRPPYSGLSPSKISLASAALVALLIASCSNFRVEPNERTVSTFGDDESHYKGRDCMSCHYASGSGEGWFSLAGSIAGNPGNSTIELYRNLGQDPIAVIQVDALGNFYTTENIDYGEDGLYVGVRSPNGELEIMERDQDHPAANVGVGPNGQIFDGGCNRCHGYTTGVIESN